MKKTQLILFVLCLSASLSCFAGSPACKPEEPMLKGVILAAETGKPLKDVSITAYSNSKKEKTVVSNASGGFSLADLKPGVYRFVFQKEGLEKVVRDKIVVKANEDYQLTIRMFDEENMFDLMPSPLRFSGSD
jgi:Carboxypeptidase regulatory-like domain